MLITKNKKIQKKIKISKSLGINKNFMERNAWFYDALNLGFNYRMNEIQASLGIEQLKKIKSFYQNVKRIFYS